MTKEMQKYLELQLLDFAVPRQLSLITAGSEERPGLAVLVGTARTGVPFKRFLGEAVEGEGGDGAFEMRGGDAPRAVGAAPAGEIVPFDPDQTFIHTSALRALGFELGARRAEHSNGSSAEGELCPPESILYGFAIGESN
jgi:hypothetical protein